MVQSVTPPDCMLQEKEVQYKVALFNICRLFYNCRACIGCSLTWIQLRPPPPPLRQIRQQYYKNKKNYGIMVGGPTTYLTSGPWSFMLCPCSIIGQTYQIHTCIKDQSRYYSKESHTVVVLSVRQFISRQLHLTMHLQVYITCNQKEKVAAQRH